MPRVIAVANLKGGCGKTTIAVNLVGALGGNVVLIDADGQQTATEWAGRGQLPFQVVPMPLDSERDVSRWLQRALAVQADVIVIDCPPHVGAATEAAVGISDLVIVPVFSSVADLSATARALELVAQARRARKGGLPRCLLVPSRIDRRTLAGREIESALKQFGEPIGPAVHQRSAFIDGCTEGVWIGAYAPNSPAAQEINELAGIARRSMK